MKPQKLLFIVIVVVGGGFAAGEIMAKIYAVLCVPGASRMACVTKHIVFIIRHISAPELYINIDEDTLL